MKREKNVLLVFSNQRPTEKQKSRKLRFDYHCCCTSYCVTTAAAAAVKFSSPRLQKKTKILRLRRLIFGSLCSSTSCFVVFFNAGHPFIHAIFDGDRCRFMEGRGSSPIDGFTHTYMHACRSGDPMPRALSSRYPLTKTQRLITTRKMVDNFWC